MNIIDIIDIPTLNRLSEIISICVFFLPIIHNPAPYLFEHFWSEQWHFQTPAMNRSESIKSSWLHDEGEQEKRLEEEKEEEGRKERRGQVWFPHLCVQTSEEKQKRENRKKNQEEKLRGIERSSGVAPGVFNLNPKSTGLLKNERLGSSSVLCHFRKDDFYFL